MVARVRRRAAECCGGGGVCRQLRVAASVGAAGSGARPGAHRGRRTVSATRTADGRRPAAHRGPRRAQPERRTHDADREPGPVFRFDRPALRNRCVEADRLAPAGRATRLRGLAPGRGGDRAAAQRIGRHDVVRRPGTTRAARPAARTDRGQPDVAGPDRTALRRGCGLGPGRVAATPAIGRYRSADAGRPVAARHRPQPARRPARAGAWVAGRPDAGRHLARAAAVSAAGLAGRPARRAARFAGGAAAAARRGPSRRRGGSRSPAAPRPESVVRIQRAQLGLALPPGNGLGDRRRPRPADRRRPPAQRSRAAEGRRAGTAGRLRTRVRHGAP